jgi:hypothetical protein
MGRSFIGFLMAVATVVFFGISPSYACNPGEAYCSGGYRYVCQCWTATGCSYSYSGLCRQDDGNDGSMLTPKFNLIALKYPSLRPAGR